MSRPKRAAIYARFSSDRQDDRSIEDQVALCRAYASRQGWSVTESFADHALSGATMHGRFSLHRMIEAARKGLVDIVVAEDLDRISRSQADIAALFERLAFADIALWTVADGLIGEMHVGLRGTMSALFLKNLALKTRRGQAGRVREGKIAGGRSFGYDPAGTGERTINQAEAQIVRRVFAETLEGRSPREIAAALNREGVKAPRGGAWNASTINGSRARGNGILRNALYVGEIVWNRQRFVRDPDTGKRVSRTNEGGERMTAAAPQLRIVDDATWRAVQAILAGKRGVGWQQGRRPRHLLSGLLKCGACGGSYIIAGSRRVGCSTKREKGTCGNGRTVSLALIETRILSALEHELLNEDAVAAAVRAYHEERKRLKAEERGAALSRARRLGELTRAIGRIVDAVVAGTSSPAMLARLGELEAEKARIDAAPEATAEIVEIHPAAAERYRAIVADVRALLSRPSDDTAPVFAALRDLIESVVIYPAGHAEDMVLNGKLAALLAPPADLTVMGRMVAGAGFEPATFRL